MRKAEPSVTLIGELAFDTSKGAPRVLHSGSTGAQEVRRERSYEIVSAMYHSFGSRLQIHSQWFSAALAESSQWLSLVAVFILNTYVF